MSLRSCALILLALLGTGGLLRSEANDVAIAARIASLIDQLGDDAYASREAAGEELQVIGEPALPPLRVAARDNDDLEIRLRARQLAGKIMFDACRSESTGLQLMYLSAGEFTMGSQPKEADRRDDELEHGVQITRPFLLGAFEVTQDEYRVVMNAQPSAFAATGESKDKVNGQDTRRYPVDSVTWFDAIAFCNRLSELDGLEPYYDVRDEQRKGESIVSAKVEVVGGLGYRLPTEAEWEYGCRAGTSTPYHFGSGNSSRGGNFQYMRSTSYGSSSSVASLKRLTTVGSYPPNPWRLHDMHGNVAEWCWDWYDKDFYSKSPDADPRGPDGGDHRVLRGGSWLVKQSSCRSATRFWHIPGDSEYYIGFRVARDASQYMISGR